MRACAVSKKTIKTCIIIKIPSCHRFFVAFRDLHAFWPPFKEALPTTFEPSEGGKQEKKGTSRLSGANLSCANLSCANLSCANLSCANMSCANVSWQLPACQLVVCQLVVCQLVVCQLVVAPAKICQKQKIRLQNSARHFAVPDEARNRPNLSKKSQRTLAAKLRPPLRRSHNDVDRPKCRAMKAGAAVLPPRGPSINWSTNEVITALTRFRGCHPRYKARGP